MIKWIVFIVKSLKHADKNIAYSLLSYQIKIYIIVLGS